MAILLGGSCRAAATPPLGVKPCKEILLYDPPWSARARISAGREEDGVQLARTRAVRAPMLIDGLHPRAPDMVTGTTKAPTAPTARTWRSGRRSQALARSDGVGF